MKLVSVEAIVDSDTSTWYFLNKNISASVKNRVFDYLWSSESNPVSGMLDCIREHIRDRR